ncbi:DUF1127 domain-containing protein [Devosia submarina]|uniref:DUF1127 domain-containing protein n=1 Tax=Devosia submarina TaxID=1173082 RepID=UPI00130086AD|nr:hypothetical protein [Devosia submarina]
MAFSLPGERSVAAALPARPFAALVRWVAEAKAARARRVALKALLELDHARLHDLGISRDDIATALATRSRAASVVLNSARARNARL